MLAAEILGRTVRQIRVLDGWEQGPYPADDVIVVRKVCFALLAAKNLVGVQIYVVGETHRGLVLSACCVAPRWKGYKVSEASEATEIGESDRKGDRWDGNVQVLGPMD